VEDDLLLGENVADASPIFQAMPSNYAEERLLRGMAGSNQTTGPRLMALIDEAESWSAAHGIAGTGGGAHDGQRDDSPESRGTVPRTARRLGTRGEDRVNPASPSEVATIRAPHSTASPGRCSWIKNRMKS
jgi:hypothetical protein